MIRYHEALSRCLDAIAQGGDLDTAITGLPARHRDRLRSDASLAEAVRRHSATVPAPSRAAEVNALSRLNAELNSVRTGREAAPRAGSLFGLPRFALAGVALAALLLGISLILGPGRGGDGTVEAADFEGVVVANGDGSLTVQTLDTLEEVMVPLEALIFDENGTALNVEAIEAGEVIVVHGNREKGGPVRALNVRRLINGLPGWCNESPGRCRQIAENLKEAQARCEREPQFCRLLHDRVTDLITRVSDVAEVEELKQRCLSGGEDCRDITSFCREHADACIRDIPPPMFDRVDDARKRLQQLEEQCRNRDTQACRTIAQICQEHAALCSDLPLSPRSPVTDAPSGLTSPTVTTSAEEPPIRPEPTATPIVDSEPESHDQAPSRIDSSDSPRGD